MSLIQEKPQSTRRPQAYVDLRDAVAPKAPARPEIGYRVEVRQKQKSKKKAGQNWLLSLALTVCCFGGSAIVTSLWGNVELEKARYQEREAIVRANEAQRMESGLRARVEALTAGGAISSWASTNGFGVFQENPKAPKPTALD